MTVRAAAAVAIRRWDGWVASRGRRRPGRTMRLFALAFLLVFLYALPEARSWHDYLWAAWSLMSTGFVAIAPKPFYDGRLEQWTGRHKVLSSVLFTLFTGFMGALMVSAFAADWKFVTLLFLGIGCVAAVDWVRGRRRATRDEVSPSEVRR